MTSRVGLARQWLEVDNADELEPENETDMKELKMPTVQTKTKPKIEVISSVDDEEEVSKEDTAREVLLKRIRELEESGVEMTDEELAEVLGVPVPEFPGDLHPIAEHEGMVEIVEHEKPDGTIESHVTAKGGARKPIDSKMKKVVSPIIQERIEDDGRDIISPMVVKDESKEEEEQPKRVSRFKAMREQNRG